MAKIGANTGQRIFLYSGSQTTGITLNANGWLVGQGATTSGGATFDSTMGITPGTGAIARPTIGGTKPALSNASGTVVTLADNNTILGVAISGGASGVAVVNNVTCNTGLIGNATTSDVTISGAAGGAFSLGAGNGNFSVNAPITSATGRSVAVAGRAGGAVSFTGAISDTGTGISLTTNTGGTINFTGGLSLSTGVNTAFSATGGGTVNATQNNTSIVNTLTTTSGTALNVVSTNIGASGLTFRSISANGAANGIILNSTGASAGLTVTGQGTTAGSGGTIQNNVQGALFTSTINLSLSNMNFTNPNSGNGTVNNIDGPTFNNAAQAGINMSSVSTVTFTNLNVNGNGGAGGVQVGINGQTVSDLTITNSTVSGFGDAATEGDIKFFNLTGTCSVTNSTFSFAAADTTAGEQLIDIRNNTGTLTLTVTGNTFNSTQTSTNGGTQLMVTAVSNATINLNVYHNSFLKMKTAGVATYARNTSTTNVNITDGGTPAVPIPGNGNIFDSQGGLGRGVDVNAQDTAHLNFNINRNEKIYGGGGPILNVFGINTAVINGRINNNADIRGGGLSVAGSAINIHPEDSSHATIEVIANTISNVGQDPGIFAFDHGNGTNLLSPVLDITIANNNVALVNNGVSGGGFLGATTGVDVRAGANNGDTATTTAYVHNNTVTAAPLAINNNDNIGGLFREGSNTSHLFLQNFQAGGSNNARAVATWNANSNAPASSVAAIDASGALAYAAGTAATPSNPNALLVAPGGVEAKRELMQTNSVSPTKGATLTEAISIKSAGRASRAFDIPSPARETNTNLTQSQLNVIVAAALTRWERTGLTIDQVAVLGRMKFEVAALPGLHLGEADGDRIRVVTNGGGNGWFIGSDDAQFATNVSGARRYTDPSSAPAGRIDLLTAIMHEMGHALGLDDTYAEQDRDNLMYGYLTKGERRLPAKNQALGVIPNEKSGTHFLTGAVNIGTLPPNKSVKIVYSVTVGPISGNPQSISSQGTVSGSNFSSVLTSDAVAGSGPTITLLGIPPSFTSLTSTTFTAGTFGTFNVTANGAPTPTITFTGTLPSGVMFGMGTLAGTATAFGTFPLVFTASNGVGSNAMQNFSLVVNPNAQDVKSKPSITENVGGGFHVAFIGNPGTQYTIQFAPTLPALPAVPNWQTLSLQTANANGIFSVDDTPPAGTTTRFYRAIIP